MATSRPALVVDDDDDWGEFSALQLSSSVRPFATASTPASGEFNIFSNVGSVIAGGVIKREVWVLDESKRFCLGKVGNNNKFCIKICAERKNHCGTGRHSSKFEVLPNTAYIKITDNQVFKAPTLSLSLLSDLQRAKLMSYIQLPAEWEVDFRRIPEGMIPEWLGEIEEVLSAGEDHESKSQGFDLLSPNASKFKSGIFDIMPTFSFESSMSETQNEDQDDHTEDRILKVETRLETLKSKLARPFIDIETSFTVLVTDLGNLHAKVKSLSAQVGSPKQGPKGLPPTLFGGLQQMWLRGDFLDESRSKLESHYNRFASNQENFQTQLDSISEELAELQGVTIQIDSWSQSVNRSMETFHRRFGVIKPLLSRFSSENKENYHEVPIPSAPPMPVASSLEPDSVLYRRILDLEEKIKILENRVVGAGVQLGGCVFQSFDDLLVWVKTKVPKGHFGLFVDGHSFLEFFTLSGHIDTETGTTAFSNSQKAGFSTYVEAQLAISFKNLFPVVFGKGGSSSLDDSDCLPAISNGDKWNNGSTGVHHQLMRNMNDVSYQLDSSIKKVFKDHLEARQLAIDCVTASKRFVLDLIAFMSQEYSTWQTRGFSKRDAWQIVCQIVRRIFEDLQSARISARNVQDFEDADFTTASFIYATLKCHDVMEVYVKHQFHAHPHVSSVITRHLAAHFVKPEKTQDSKILSFEAKVTALSSKVDSYVSKVELLVTKEKERKFQQDKHKQDKPVKKSKVPTEDSDH